MGDTTIPVNDTILSPSSRPATPAEAAPSSEPRRSTILPHVQWQGQTPTVVRLERSRFEEVRELGRGGMGEVVLARDHDIDRTVALKRLPGDCDVDRVVRFIEEIRTVGGLDHPNIVPLHDVGVDEDGRYFFIMKHLEGETLEAVIERLKAGDPAAHRQYPFDVRVQIILSMLNGIAVAHRKGIIHRDLKPANIMIGLYGQVTIMDWGLAKRIHAGLAYEPSSCEPAPAPEPAGGVRDGTALQTMLGAVVGTPMYMSPEQAVGANDALDERSDLYSITVIMHELLYLEHYLAARTSLPDILRGVQEDTPTVHDVKTSPHQPYVPAELGWYVLKGLEKDVARRYQTAEEMIDELQRVISGKVRVNCHRTMAKRMLYGMDQAVDAHPVLFIVLSTAVVSVLLAGVVQTVLNWF